GLPFALSAGAATRAQSAAMPKRRVRRATHIESTACRVWHTPSNEGCLPEQPDDFVVEKPVRRDERPLRRRGLAGERRAAPAGLLDEQRNRRVVPQLELLVGCD